MVFEFFRYVFSLEVKDVLILDFLKSKVSLKSKLLFARRVRRSGFLAVSYQCVYTTGKICGFLFSNCTVNPESLKRAEQ